MAELFTPRFAAVRVQTADVSSQRIMTWPSSTFLETKHG
jgi:hypothetical protein